MRQLAVPLLIVHTVTDDKNIGDFESAVGNWKVNQSSSRFIEQRAQMDAGRLALAEIVQKVVRSQPGIDDVLDEKHVTTGDAFIEIFGYADDSGAWLSAVT